MCISNKKKSKKLLTVKLIYGRSKKIRNVMIALLECMRQGSVCVCVCVYTEAAFQLVIVFIRSNLRCNLGEAVCGTGTSFSLCFLIMCDSWRWSVVVIHNYDISYNLGLSKIWEMLI